MEALIKMILMNAYSFRKVNTTTMTTLGLAVKFLSDDSHTKTFTMTVSFIPGRKMTIDRLMTAPQLPILTHFYLALSFFLSMKYTRNLISNETFTEE